MTRMTRLLMGTLAAALLLLAGACEGEPGSEETFAEPCLSNEDDDVREAAFRWLFEHQGGGTQVACLGIAHGEAFGYTGATPGDGFLDRFDDLDMSLYSEPRCRYPDVREDPGEPMCQQVDGERAVLFQVGSVCRNGDKAVTSGSASVCMLMAVGIGLELQRQADGTWKVTGDWPLWIS